MVTRTRVGKQGYGYKLAVVFDLDLNLVLGLWNQVTNQYQVTNPNNASLVINYLREQHMLGWKRSFKNKCVFWPCRLSKLTGHKDSQELIEEDIQAFALSYNKGEIDTDPKHGWIGTYNVAQTHITKFIKFVFFLNISYKKRPVPDILRNFVQLRRQEEFVYEPKDVWTDEDHATFSKYCPGLDLHMVF